MSFHQFKRNDYLEGYINVQSNNIEHLRNLMYRQIISTQALRINEKISVEGTKEWLQFHKLTDLVNINHVNKWVETYYGNASVSIKGTQYLNPDDLIQKLSHIEKTFNSKRPNTCESLFLKYRTTGYDAQGVRVKPQKPTYMRIGTKGKPGILLIAGTHGDEYVTSIAITYFLEELSNASSANQNKILDNFELFVVPLLNPDGLNYSLKTGKHHRKNTNTQHSKLGESGFGVDPNRNYPTYFGFSGSSPVANHNIFSGPFPFSDSEASNVEFLVRRHKNIVIGIDCHAGANKAVFHPIPTKMVSSIRGKTFVKQIDPTYSLLYSIIDKDINKNLNNHCETCPYQLGSCDDYAGTSDEFFLHNVGILGYSIELHEKKDPKMTRKLISDLGEFSLVIHSIIISALENNISNYIKRSIVNKN